MWKSHSPRSVSDTADPPKVQVNKDIDGRTELRKPFIAGNWKMNLVRDSCLSLVHLLQHKLQNNGKVEVAVCPPLVYLHDVGSSLRGSHIGLGAQNMYYEREGAFTGEISGGMLRDVGCRYVILGHSERRQLLGETDAIVNKKILAALRSELTPIVCVGETLQEREAGVTKQVITTQMKGSLSKLSSDQGQQLVIAYEPVWAIGTGKTATPAQAEEVHAQIRMLLNDFFGKPIAESIRIQYGGSVKPDNAVELLSQPNIDGALVGGASLKAADFAAIVEAAAA
jgi:triosephosphate isomerase